jgi:hypothetical protein
LGELRSEERLVHRHINLAAIGEQAVYPSASASLSTLKDKYTLRMGLKRSGGTSLAIITLSPI